MSQWYCQVLGEEMGPVAWLDLVELVRSGTVGHSDLVRREATGAWEPAEKVVGLFRAAKQNATDAPAIPVSASSPTPKPVSRDATKSPKRPSPGKSSSPKSHGSAAAASALLQVISKNDDETQSAGELLSAAMSRRSRWPQILMGLTVIVLMGALGGWWASRQAAIFPEHQMKASAAGVATPAHLLTAPVPKSPSVPGLAPGVAVLLPGFEGIEQLYSPCLSGDLRTIVFAHLTDGKTWFDLYTASRANVSEPFGPPKLLATCQSEELDAYPALTMDLRELIFVRSEENPRLMRSTRASASDEFGTAVEVQLTGVDWQASAARLGWPQFVNPETICFARHQLEPSQRLLWLAKRDSQGHYAVVHLLACQEPWAPWIISANAERAYHGTEAGMFVSARQSGAHPYGHSVTWADVAQTGAIDGPIWVAPAEDVIVYCSAGPGEKPGKSRKFWMFRKGADGGTK